MCNENLLSAYSVIINAREIEQTQQKNNLNLKNELNKSLQNYSENSLKIS